MTSVRFGGVLTAWYAVRCRRGALDLDAAADLARWLEANGNDGLVVAGTTGESTDAHRRRAAVCSPRWPRRSTSRHRRHRDERHGALRARHRRGLQLGVAGVLAVCPYYNRPSQAGLDAHFRAVAAATALPVIVYDIPIRTGRKIATDTLASPGREVPNIVAVKDAAGNPAETAR